MKQVLLIVALLTALAACWKKEEPRVLATAPTGAASERAQASAPVSVPVYYGTDIDKKGGVTRFIDGDAGVLCYRDNDFTGYACVPLSHTTLREDGIPRYPHAASTK